MVKKQTNKQTKKQNNNNNNNNKKQTGTRQCVLCCLLPTKWSCSHRQLSNTSSREFDWLLWWSTGLNLRMLAAANGWMILCLHNTLWIFPV